jgi:hypothetical protein
MLLKTGSYWSAVEQIPNQRFLPSPHGLVVDVELVIEASKLEEGGHRLEEVGAAARGRKDFADQRGAGPGAQFSYNILRGK